ncbi:MAG: flavodoxin domain-containing protein [Bryobacteraceae bacterium]
MNPVLILYSSGGGHTARIANHLASTMAMLGLETHVVDSAKAAPDMALGDYSGLVALSSVRSGKHGESLTKFITTNVSRLPKPSLFLSVSLTYVTLQDPNASAASKAKASADVQRLIDEFINETGWRPGRALGVAGDLPYTKYSWLLRLFMKWLVKKSGGPTDTSRDYVFTDWGALDAVAREFAHEVAPAAKAAAPAVS